MLNKAIGHFALKAFRKMHDSLSDTQRTALESGTVGFEASLYKGVPDWKGLLSTPAPSLSPEERSFLDNEVEELCRMIDAWKVEDELKDLPPEAWQYAKDKKFLGMIIPKEYGGLGFSQQAHSAVISKLFTRSGTAGTHVMVPNSLGSAELILQYGTEEQKEYYLPRLARGEEVPCFALTSPQAGSDATNQKDEGTVFRGDDGKLYIRLSWEKRYTTLAPVATLFSIAFKLKDPDRLLGGKKNPGITVALVPKGLPGMHTGMRHRPIGTPMQNGPHWGEDVVIPADNIIGGTAYAGKGWDMLIECLSIGRSISLPAASTGMARYATRVTGAYAGIRQQFGMTLSDMESVQEGVARVAGLTYMMDSVRTLPLLDMDLAHADGGDARPAVASAILKYHLTESARQIAIDAMDIHGGKGVVKGPNNPVAHLYESIPVGITVEGANYLTHGLIFGQGAFMAHPYVLDEMKAGRDEDAGKAGDLALKHLSYIFKNAVAGTALGLTNGRFSASPNKGPDARFYQHINRLSRSFAYTSNVAMLFLQSALIRKQRISNLLGDTSAHLYMASQVLNRWNYEGRRKEDRPLMEWATTYCLNKAESALNELVDNFGPGLKAMTRPVVAPRTLLPLPFIDNRTHIRKPSHRLDSRVARAVCVPGPLRDHMTAGMYIPKEKEEYLARLEDTLDLAQKALPHEKKLYKLAKNNDRIQTKMPLLLQSVATGTEKVKRKADKEFRNVALDELRLAIKNDIFRGHLNHLHYNDIPEIRNRMEEVIYLAYSNSSGPEQCRKMAHTVIEEMGDLVRKNQPERDRQDVWQMTSRAKDIAVRIVTRAALAQRAIYTEIIEEGLRKTAGGSLMPRETAREAAVAIAQRVADRKEFLPESYAQAAAFVLPKFVDARTLSQSENYLEMVREAKEKKIINADTANLLRDMNAARNDIIKVDHFPAEWFGEPMQGITRSAPLAAPANDVSASGGMTPRRSMSPGEPA